MQRSVGVTISAIVVLLGSLWTLVGTVGALVFPPNYPELLRALEPYPEARQAALADIAKEQGFLFPLVFLLLAAWGITTSIGLFRLRNWGRISMIIFAATLMQFFVMASWVLWPLSEGIAIWWLVFFNLPHVKAQFMP